LGQFWFDPAVKWIERVLRIVVGEDGHLHAVEGVTFHLII